MKLPHSLEIERTFLATLIRNPEIIPDYLEYLTDDLFHSDIHKIIVGAIRFQYKSKKTVDVVILSDHIANIGLKNQDDLDLPEYIAMITARNSVEAGKAEVYFKDCVKYKVARTGIVACRQTELDINKAINGSVGDVIGATEKGLAKAVTSSVEDEYNPVDVYADMDVFCEEQGQDPALEGVMTPFKTWNRWWGPLTVGDLTVIAAPPKTGKSTILNYLADAPFCKYNNGRKIKVLILDTELESYRVRTRKVSALSDVSEIYIKNGKWQNDSDMAAKVTAQFPKMKKRAGYVKHQYVANVPIEKICSIVRRWAATETDTDDFRIVIYDYFKITGEAITAHNQEWQVLGSKVDTFKHLLSEPGVRAAGIAAVQTNSANDVAASQRIKWFASAIMFFTKKTPEELATEGEEFGTHYLRPFCLRNQAEDWENEEWVKEQKKDGILFTKNRLNLFVHNFDMKECGTYADVVNKLQEQIDISNPPAEGEGRGRKKDFKTMPEDDLL